ncbi:MAG: hypothetical protein V1804_01275 [Patescibacteria group bacterium]
MNKARVFLVLGLVSLAVSLYFFNLSLLASDLKDPISPILGCVIFAICYGHLASASVNRLPINKLGEIMRIEDIIKTTLIVMNISAWFLGGLAFFILCDILQVSEESVRPAAICIAMNSLFLLCAYGHYEWLKEDRLDGIRFDYQYSCCH